MGAAARWVIPLARAADADEQLVGGKAAKLGQLMLAGFRVPDGFSITTAAYERFLEHSRLEDVIRMELGRKPLESMRWEEVWDTALRIRSAFLAAPVPASVADQIARALRTLGAHKAVAVRSSAPGEDSAGRSFAGLHESYVGLAGVAAVLDAVRKVWASLWSDAALLYRKELSLDPARSRMAVLVQELIDEDRSGVAFGRDPRDVRQDRAIVEAVPGPCSDLVDGAVDPDRWVLRRSTGDVLEWRPGDRGDEDPQAPLLQTDDLDRLHRTLQQVEALFHWPPDTEWTGQQDRFTLLQARPITTSAPERGDNRDWYLTLRPSLQRLRKLRQLVADELIPELEALGNGLAAEPLDAFDDTALAASIEERLATVEAWRQTYWDKFIPFAHGVRQLGTTYNDLVRPDDPYEFVGLLRGQRMLAAQRNQVLDELARDLRQNPPLAQALTQALEGAADLRAVLLQAEDIAAAERFAGAFEEALASLMDVTYENERLADRPELLLRTVLQTAQAPERPAEAALDTAPLPTSQQLEQRLLNAAGPERAQEVREILAIGRLSWRLRDDDNILIGRLESQLLRAVRLGTERLQAAGRLEKHPSGAGEKAAATVAAALREPEGGAVELPTEETEPRVAAQGRPGESPRQLVGQPASPGLAAGRVRRVVTADDLGRFQAGEVLVCDAIQPTMTHLVPLAVAIVERRGGMLIHGAIIARELGIPCVNGIANATDLLEDGELVTVDGFLGIVTVGPPEFDLEEVRLAASAP